MSIQAHDLYSKIVRGILDSKSKTIYQRMLPYLVGNKILDVGTGAGGIASYFKEKGFDVESIDIDDSSLVKGFPTKIYDGKIMPFGDNAFSTAIIVHVLHHCEDGLAVLHEAKRVSKRVIFIEDTYFNKFERAVVSFSDMIGNNEFFDHYYRTPKEWNEVIRKNGWKDLYTETYSEFTYGVMYGRYVMCVVE